MRSKRKISRILLLGLGLAGLMACGGGRQASLVRPAAANLSVGFGLKQLQFSWTAASGATSYRLLQNPDGMSGFTQVGADLSSATTATALDIAVHRHNWAVARYALDACNSAGCTRSNEVSTTAGMLQAIGYFKASNTGAGDQFGFSVGLSGDGNTLAVGALFEASAATGINGDQVDNSASGAGAVYSYRRLTALKTDNPTTRRAARNFRGAGTPGEEG